MALYEPVIAMAFHAFAYDISRFRVGHPAVDDIDAFLRGVADEFDGMRFVVAFQPFRAKTDLADFKPCFSKKVVRS